MISSTGINISYNNVLRRLNLRRLSITFGSIKHLSIVYQGTAHFVCGGCTTNKKSSANHVFALRRHTITAQWSTFTRSCSTGNLPESIFIAFIIYHLSFIIYEHTYPPDCVTVQCGHRPDRIYRTRRREKYGCEKRPDGVWMWSCVGRRDMFEPGRASSILPTNTVAVGECM